MNDSERLALEVGALRDRLSRLSEASLRINESLDFETVLQGVLDSARSLTDARYGVIEIPGGAGQAHTLFSGLSREEIQAVYELPDVAALCDYLAAVEEPQRLRDFHGHIESLGFPELRLPVPVDPVFPLLSAPIRHHGEVIGNVYLAQKEKGQEFTAEDEETLVMFASQAALVITNARRHRDEQRARADLETLIDTSLVGVVVFDAKTGKLSSVNQETLRIASMLHSPDRPLEELIENITVRRADGREIFLGEYPLTETVNIGETVRAEELVFQVPDGRSVTVLINATPIWSEDGEKVESLVVTLQDMTPLEELERLRAEFLAMVSHELRTPLTSIKGSATTLLTAGSDLDTAEMAQFHRIIDQQADHMRDLIGALLDVARIEAGELPVVPEPSHLTDLVDEARIRFLTAHGRYELHIDLEPDLPRVMTDRRRIVQVLNNLLSNAARYSPSESAIRLVARREGVHVTVSVIDQGRGVPAERLPHLFRKFSRLDGEDWNPGIGDAGLGLSICKGIVEAHGGRIWAESDGVGLGARFTFTIPAVDEAPTSPATVSPRRQRVDLETEQLRILVVDDDPQTLRYVRDALTRENYVPIVTGEPDQVPSLMTTHRPHLVLLDLMLPGVDGMDLMQDILATDDVPIIFLSAYGQDRVIARAFEMGADDYVVKPFSPTELVARIRAALSKRIAPGRPEPAEPYVYGNLTINYVRRAVMVGDRPVRLTAIEYRMLAELAVYGGQVLTYEHLMQRVWRQSRSGDLRPMRTVVRNLRAKLGDDANNPSFIFTEPRVGYRMPQAGEPAPVTH